jgi:5-methylcytosine-specific restriction endonuclease McrA
VVLDSDVLTSALRLQLVRHLLDHGVRRCAEHATNGSMTHRWPTKHGGTPTASSRATKIPGWSVKRAQVRQRDVWLCQIRLPGCLVNVTESDPVDHVVPAHLGGSTEIANLQSCCRPCHDKKTAAEARAARP